MLSPTNACSLACFVEAERTNRVIRLSDLSGNTVPWEWEVRARLTTPAVDVLSGLFGGRHAVFYSITTRRTAHPEDFKADMAILFDLLRDRAIHPVVIDRLPLAAAREVHIRIDLGGLGGKIVLLPWPEA
jgi:hypothetical protein